MPLGGSAATQNLPPSFEQRGRGGSCRIVSGIHRRAMPPPALSSFHSRLSPAGKISTMVDEEQHYPRSEDQEVEELLTHSSSLLIGQGNCFRNT